MQVLLIDDTPYDYILVVRTLVDTFGALECTQVNQPRDLDTVMTHAAYDIVLTEDHLSWTDGLKVLQRVREQWPYTPVVMLIENDNEAMALKALQAGLSDYVYKSMLHRLPVVVQGSLEKARLEGERRHAEEKLHIRIRQQAAVADLGQRALAGMPLGTLLDEAVTLVASTLDVEYCKVLELLPDGTALRLRAGVCWHAGLVGIASVGSNVDSQAGYTLLSDTPVVVYDLRTEARFHGPPLLHEHGVVSGMSVIIRGTPRPFGVLGAHTTRCREFTTDDTYFLQAVANILGQAIARQRTEALLQQSEATLATIFRTSPNAILLTRLSDGVCVAANEHFTYATGYAVSEILGTAVQTLNLWRYPEDWQRIVQALRGSGEILNLEIAFRRKDGTAKTGLLSARVVDMDGTPHILSVTQDISALKHAEAAHAAEARFLRVQLEVAQVALSSLQADVLLPQLLAVICRAQGYQVGLLWRLVEGGQHIEIVATYGEGTEAFVGYRREVQDTLSPAAEAIRTGQPVFLNHLVTSPRVMNPLTRSLAVQSIMALPLIARTEAIIGVLNLGDTENPARFTRRDVEQGIVLAHQVSRAAENSALFSQLQRLQEQYRVVTDTLLDAVYTVDLAGCITFANPALACLTGYAVEELMGQSALMLHPPDLNPILIERLQAAWRGDAPPPYLRTQFLHKHGQRIDAEIAATTLVLEGQIVGRVIAVRDIGTRLQLEAELRQSQKLQALGTLAGGIAHDFNNILAAILGYAELTLAVMPEPHVIRKNLQQILIASDRARTLIQQMLAFSRQTKLARQPLQLYPLIKEGLTLLRAALPATITLEQRLDAQAGTVLADPTQMQQVLFNLCANAEHAMRHSGGRLDIELDAITLLPHAVSPHPDLTPGAYVRLRVRDTGHGMESQVCERIFEPFFTTKAVGEGTGLGLAVVHGIITDHGGVIMADSTLGQGTTFTVYLPCYDGEITSSSPAAAAAPHGHERILLVDDEVHLVQLGQAMLSRLGYDVTSYTSSLEALGAFRAAPQQFDLVITDQTIPDLTGDALVQELRRLRPDIPIILCTGFSHTMDEEKARRLGLDALCLKPFRLHDLGVQIRRVLDQRAIRHA